MDPFNPIISARHARRRRSRRLGVALFLIVLGATLIAVHWLGPAAAEVLVRG